MKLPHAYSHRLQSLFLPYADSTVEKSSMLGLRYDESHVRCGHIVTMPSEPYIDFLDAENSTSRSAFSPLAIVVASGDIMQF